MLDRYGRRQTDKVKIYMRNTEWVVLVQMTLRLYLKTQLQ